jgi:hypothetical protein
MRGKRVSVCHARTRSQLNFYSSVKIEGKLPAINYLSSPLIVVKVSRGSACSVML